LLRSSLAAKCKPSRQVMVVVKEDVAFSKLLFL
jgi:hypothetical protein